MALNGLFCADVPLRNYSLTHSPLVITVCRVILMYEARVANSLLGNHRFRV